MLSPIFTERHKLPEWLFFIGAEYDMLCHESQEMIMNMAGLKGSSREEMADAFEIGTCRWRKVKGVVHGFTHFIPSESADDKKSRLERRKETYEEVVEWLFKGPFAQVKPNNVKG